MGLFTTARALSRLPEIRGVPEGGERATERAFLCGDGSPLRGPNAIWGPKRVSRGGRVGGPAPLRRLSRHSQRSNRSASFQPVDRWRFPVIATAPGGESIGSVSHPPGNGQTLLLPSPIRSHHLRGVVHSAPPRLKPAGAFYSAALSPRKRGQPGLSLGQALRSWPTLQGLASCLRVRPQVSPHPDRW